ncbi:MAG: aldehyde ferredoxin oxidoreductase C-terminal domain-containing protein, partial [Candidatus Bathyarchaeia archaeon]
LKFGSPETVVKMTEMIGKREGFGDILADGSRKAAQKIGKGAEYYAMQVKGQEMPAYDPRGVFGHGLNYAMSNRGACHVRGYVIASEVFGIPTKTDPFDYSKSKVKLVKVFEDLTAAVDSSLTCLFTTFAIGAPEYAAAIAPLTGWTNYTDKEFMETGDRVWTLERAFNAREGFGRKDDLLPRRILTEPLPDGPAKGKVHPLDKMMDVYYEVRGYDKEGHPTPKKMSALGLP